MCITVYNLMFIRADTVQGCLCYVPMFLRADAVRVVCLCTVYVLMFVRADAIHCCLCYVLCMCSCS